MRKHKYRAIGLYQKEWFVGSLITDGQHPMKTAYILPDDATNYDEMVEVDPATVGQYTGLKDLEENEIYEGDLIIFDGGYGLRGDGKRVEYVDGEFTNVTPYSDGGCCFDPVVVGNIHDRAQ